MNSSLLATTGGVRMIRTFIGVESEYEHVH
jgi:hypothetical protein